MLTCSWVHHPMIGWSDPIVNLQLEAAKLWAHRSQPFCHRPQGETHGVLDTLFWHASERTQQQTLSWCTLPTKRALVTLRLTIHPSRKHVSLFSNVTLPLIQRHGFKVTPSPMTCEILMISKISFSTASIPTWFPSAGNMHLCFPKKEELMPQL
jgi:hypothetical protein